MTAPAITDTGTPPPRPGPRRRAGPRSWSRRPLPLRWLPLAVVLLLVVVELATRAVEDWLPVSQAGDAVEVELKYEQILALEEADERTDVVVFGNSAMDAAMDPAVWAEASAAYPLAFNASLMGQPFDSMRRWGTDFVLPHVEPALVIVGVTPFDVPQIDVLNTSRAIVEKLFDDAMDRLSDGPLARADRRLRDQSAIARHRASFRSPVQLLHAGSDRVTGADKPKQDSLQPVLLADGTTVARTEEVWRRQLMKPRGGMSNYWGQSTARPLGFGFDTAVQREIFRSSRTTVAQMSAFAAMAEGDDAEVVFVIPPSLAGAYTPFTGSEGATEAAERHVREVATRIDIAIVDFSETDYPADHFADPIHLNKRGSEVFSRELAAAVDEL